MTIQLSAYVQEKNQNQSSEKIHQIKKVGKLIHFKRLFPNIETEQ